jgi:hypothetical protein
MVRFRAYRAFLQGSERCILKTNKKKKTKKKQKRYIGPTPQMSVPFWNVCKSMKGRCQFSLGVLPTCTTVSTDRLQREIIFSINIIFYIQTNLVLDIRCGCESHHTHRRSSCSAHTFAQRSHRQKICHRAKPS